MMSKYNMVFILLSLILIAGLGCTPATTKSQVLVTTSPAPIDTPVTYSLEITDQLGRVVKFSGIPKRIVSLAPSNTEILYTLGLKDRVVGVTDYDNYPPEAKEKPSIGGFSSPNIEKIVDLSPDLIVAAPIHQKQIIPQLEAKGLTVVALAPKNINEILDAIALVGNITGQNNTTNVITGMQTRLKSITNKTGNLLEAQKPRIFYITWHEPLRSAGSGTFLDELISAGGGTNIAGNLNGYPTMTLEAVIEANPEVIIAGVGMGAGADAPLQFAKSEPRLKDLAARQNNRVYSIDADLVGRAGPRITDALEQFARTIHPELFK